MLIKGGKMKKVILLSVIALALLVFVSCATTSSADLTELYTGVQKVIDIPNNSKAELFVKANNWAVAAFNNAESVIEFSDKDSGSITGKYIAKYSSVSIPFGICSVEPLTLMRVEIKDNKARISLNLTGIDYYNGAGVKFNDTAGVNSCFKKAEADILKAKWDEMIASLETALNANNADW